MTYLPERFSSDEPVYHACAQCMKERSSQTVAELRAMVLAESKQDYDAVTAMALYCTAEYEIRQIHARENHVHDFANFVFLVVDDAEITDTVFIRMSNILGRIESQKSKAEMARRSEVGWGLKQNPPAQASKFVPQLEDNRVF